VRISIVSLGLLAAGCSSADPVDLTGVYRVDDYLASSPCGSDYPQPYPPASLKLSDDVAGGEPYIAVDECDHLDGTQCRSFAVAGLFDRIGDTWGIREGFAATVNGACSMLWVDSIATLDGSQLTFEYTRYEGSVTTPPESCTKAEAEARGDSLMCEAHMLLHATKL
jgi:hypothetical protein